MMHPFPEGTRVRIVKHSHIAEHVGRCGRVRFSGMGYAVKIDGDPLLAVCSEDEVEEENAAMTILKCGFDKVGLKDTMAWLTITSTCKLYGHKELDDEKGFLWTGQHLKVLTGDDPMTGLSRIKAMRHEIKRGWPGYIGVEGDPQAVLEFVGLIFMHAEYVKNFDPRCSSFITLP